MTRPTGAAGSAGAVGAASAVGSAREAAGRGRPYEPVLRRRDWTFPPPAVKHREIISVLPEQPVLGRPPLLLVHGATMGAWAWEPWQQAAADAGWESHAVSLRGHGGSDAPTPLGRTPLRYYEHDVMQAITALPAPPVLIGHAMGGLVVQHVLERYRAAPAGVLIGSAPPTHGIDVAGTLLRHEPSSILAVLAGRSPRPKLTTLFADPDSMETAEAERVRQRMGYESPVAGAQMILPRRKRDVRTPLLVLGGGDDRTVPPHVVTRTARAFGTRAHLFRGMGHLLMFEPQNRAPLEFVLAWLDRTLLSGDGTIRPMPTSRVGG